MKEKLKKQNERPFFSSVYGDYNGAGLLHRAYLLLRLELRIDALPPEKIYSEIYPFKDYTGLSKLAV